MADREMQRRANQHDDESDAEPQHEDAAATKDDALTDDVDAILDEIDDVLEANAAEFVQGFVQKGGQ